MLNDVKWLRMAICSSCSSFLAAWLGSPTRSVPNHWVEALTFRLAINLRYVEILLFHVIWGFYKWGPFMETIGNPWNHREDSCLRNRFLKPARFPFQMVFIGADSRRKEPVFSLTHVRLWVVKTWDMSSLVMSGRASRHTLIPKSRQPEFSSKADFEIHPVFSICSPPLTHLPNLPKASEHLQDFGRFRCRHSAACFRFNLQQLPTAWVCGSIFSLISPFPEVVRIPHLPLTSGNLLLKHCQVPAFEATSCNFSQAEPSWVENWYIQ